MSGGSWFQVFGTLSRRRRSYTLAVAYGVCPRIYEVTLRASFTATDTGLEPFKLLFYYYIIYNLFV